MRYPFLLGTYTRKNSKGIYEGVLDTDKKAIVDFHFLQEEVNPTYLTISKKGILYTIGEMDEKGSVSSYSPVDDHFQFLNAVSKSGSAPCYVAVDEKRQLVYSANYHQGHLRSYNILEDGALTLADEVQHFGSGPHPNQEKPHVHYTDLTPNSLLAVCDLGNDTVATYLPDETGKLTEVAVFHAIPGTGPRHLVFHPNGKYAYLIGELANTITVLSYQTDGSFKLVETYPTLPQDFTGENSGGAIHISNDGKFLYASNRGENTIIVFEITEGGKILTLKQRIASGGDFPRDFNLDPSNQFIICAHQKSSDLALFERNLTTGKLTFLNSDIEGPEGVCVYFKEVDFS